MRRSAFSNFVRGLSFLLALSIGAAAAENKPRPGKLNSVVRTVNKDTSTKTVRKGNADRQIVFDANTKFTQGTRGSSKPVSIDELKEGWYVNCAGTFDGIKLVAKACRFREERGTTQR